MSVPQEQLISLEQYVVESADLLQGLPSDEGAAIQTAMLGRFAGIVEHCAAVAEQAGLLGLQDACFHLSDNLTRLDEKGERDSPSELRLLGEWSGLVLDYLSASPHADSSEEPVSALLRHLQDAYWENPLPREDVEVMRDLLMQWQVDFGSESADDGLLSDETAASETAEGYGSEPSSDVLDEESVRNAPISVDPDTLLLLQGEMSGLMEILVMLTSGEDMGEEGEGGFQRIAGMVDRLVMAAQAIGFPSLHRTFSIVQANLQRFDSDADTAAQELEVLLDWAALARAYLEAPAQPDQTQALVEILTDSRWPAPLPREGGVALSAGFTAITLESGSSEGRETQAGWDDVSLAIPEDINPELLEGLLQELPAQTTEFSEAVEKLTRSGHFADIDTARRIAHTLKGAANVVGIQGLANLTHQLEDILNALSKFGDKPPAVLAQTLIDAADCLAEMNDFLLGLGPQPPQALQVLQEVLDWANRIDREGISADVPGTLPDAAPTRKNAEDIARDSTAHQPEIGPDKSPAEAHVQATPMLRVPAALLDNLLRLAGESIILSGRLQDGVLGSIRQARAVRAQNLAMQQLIQELEHLVDVRGISLPGGVTQDSGKTASFDPLELEQYNELYTVVRQLQEVATDSRELSRDVDSQLAQLKGLLGDQLRLNHEHQQAALLTRMVPVKTVEQRLYRGVRQACRLTEKSASLTIKGTDTLVESNVLNDLIEPLMHVLRNAVDHGIEDADTREREGKPAKGRIELGFAREGNYILVQCEDDGGGLDYEAIQRRAIEMALLKSGVSTSEDMLNRILMSPGFSTRSGVTQVSGRGIGMDVVQTAVRELRGSVNIRSRAGQGCRVELRIPVTLLSTQALLIRSRQRMFAVSERGIQQVLHSDAGRMSRIGDSLTFETEERVFGVKLLDEILGFPPLQDNEQRLARPVILVELGPESTLAVLVDEVLDSRELVVKPMGPYVPRIPGIPGATILGDGSIVPVLDLPELIEVPVLAGTAAVTEQAIAGAESVVKTALVVDDSLSARRSLAQFVKDAGFEVRTAIDGLEAIGIIDAAKPDILFVDMEMPRMNGMELTAHLRANPETSDLPVIMITSRSTDKHRLQALNMGVDSYLTKPFAEEQLLRQIGQVLGGT